MNEKTWFRLCLMAMLAFATPTMLVGCGDDDEEDEGGDGDSGGDGDGDTGDGDTGDGDSGDGDGADACEPGFTASDACTACLCEENESATSSCNEGCWGLLTCVAVNCPDDPESGCAFTTCNSFVAMPGAATGAPALGDPLRACTAECMDDFPEPAGGDEDAGM